MRTLSASPQTRWMALLLPGLPIDRLLRQGVLPSDDRPVALYARAGNALLLTAVNRQAAKAGLAVGMPLADARAIRPDLVGLVADEAADRRFLEEVAIWCDRFTPTVALDPPDGLFLEIGGSAHLFGGEAALLAGIESRLKAQGLSVRAAIAPNPAAAWAFARFGENRLVDEGMLRQSLAPLPVACLRLTPAAVALLKRLGLKRVGQIMEAPRAPFTARAGQDTTLRLDQALGRVTMALSPCRPVPPVFALRRLLEPIVTLDAILFVVESMCGEIAEKLRHGGLGLRVLRLSLYGVDGRTRSLKLALTALERDPKAMLRVLRERLNVAAETFECEFGFEIARLDADEIAPIVPRETDLGVTDARDADSEARLIDTLAARLGAGRVGRLAVHDVHAPERASVWAPPSHPVGQGPVPPEDAVMRRPLQLFARPQPVDVIASVPDGPPVRFRWRRVLRQVTRAEGPERITPNWLRAPAGRTRDYYRVEDREGRRYWLYREGAYDEALAPRWFLHGLFP